MKRAWFALSVAILLSTSSGCCLVDRIFHCHHGWCGPSTYEDCCWEGHDCGGCGGCDSCGGGGCDSCGGGSGYDVGCSECGGSEITGPMQAYDAAHTAHCAGGRCNLAARRMADYNAPAGPPTAAITYPYYTNRGPRDFLARNPGSIGP